MSVKIQIQNFQSIQDAEIVLDGFTVVTGANNSGKTAAMRAVQATFSNPPISAFLRDGTDTLSVSLEFDGHSLEWSKGNKVKPTYVVDGKTLHPGREIPSEVSGLGISPIQSGGVTLWPQIAPQFTGVVFLLDQSGSVIAEAVTDADRVGKLNAALKLAESDRRSYAAEMKLRQKDLSNLSTEVARYHGLDDALEEVRKVESLKEQLDKVGRVLAGFTSIKERMDSCKQVMHSLSWVEHVSIPDALDLQTTNTQSLALQRLLAQHTDTSRQVSRLSWVSNPPCVDAVFIPTDDIRTLRALYQQWQVLTNQVEKIQVPMLRFDDYGKLPKILDLYHSLASIQNARQSESEHLRKAEMDVTTQQDAMTALHQERESILKDMGTCPTCGGDTHGIC